MTVELNVPAGKLPLVTNPLRDPIDATATLLLLHVPPGVASLSVILTPPEHIATGPSMGVAEIAVSVVVAAVPQPLE